jgi:exosortase F-associated protein
MLLSLAILWLVFKKKSVLKVATVLYAGLFIFVFIAFVILLDTSDNGNYLLLFYIRRFLIQPIFLLILLPAFYFQHKK